MEKTEIEEIFAGLGPVTIKPIFGGKGVCYDGLIIAIELQGEIRLKADPVSARDFEAADAHQWVYENNKGKTVAMPYWSILEDAFDDADAMDRWVRLAFDAALRSRER